VHASNIVQLSVDKQEAMISELGIYQRASYLNFPLLQLCYQLQFNGGEDIAQRHFAYVKHTVMGYNDWR